MKLIEAIMWLITVTPKPKRENLRLSIICQNCGFTTRLDCSTSAPCYSMLDLEYREGSPLTFYSLGEIDQKQWIENHVTHFVNKLIELGWDFARRRKTPEKVIVVCPACIIRRFPSGSDDAGYELVVPIEEMDFDTGEKPSQHTLVNQH